MAETRDMLAAVDEAAGGVDVPDGLRWLKDRVREGLKVLVAGKFARAPARDILREIGQTAVLVLLDSGRDWNAERDTALLRRAFTRLAAAPGDFPQAGDILRELEAIEEEHRQEAEGERLMAQTRERLKERQRQAIDERAYLAAGDEPPVLREGPPPPPEKSPAEAAREQTRQERREFFRNRSRRVKRILRGPESPEAEDTDGEVA